MPETMSQACRWRLKAEKVRKNADGFSSASAKETMLFVAEGWDWLADNVERRLGKEPNASLLRWVNLPRNSPHARQMRDIFGRPKGVPWADWRLSPWRAADRERSALPPEYKGISNAALRTRYI